jgi:hypothetical protein
MMEPNAEDRKLLEAPEENPFRDVDIATPRKAAKAAELVRPKYYDAALGGRIQKLHNRGIWTDLGPNWGGLLVRLRPTHSHHVVVRRENAENAMRIQLGLADDDPIPANENIAVNRAAVTHAITAADGVINIGTASLDPEDADTPELQKVLEGMRSLAESEKGQAAGISLSQEGDLLLARLTGMSRRDKERPKLDPKGLEAEYTREFLAGYLEISFPFLTTLVRNCRALQKVKDEELGKLGELFVYGRNVKEDWAD